MAQLLSDTIESGAASTDITVVPGTLIGIQTSGVIHVQAKNTAADPVRWSHVASLWRDSARNVISPGPVIRIVAPDGDADVLIHGDEA